MKFVVVFSDVSEDEVSRVEIEAKSLAGAESKARSLFGKITKKRKDIEYYRVEKKLTL